VKVQAIMFRENSPIKSAKEQTEIVIDALAVIISEQVINPARKKAAALLLTHFIPDWRTLVEDLAVVVNRNDPLVRKWRKSVLERDNHTCQVCSNKGNHAHHQIQWSDSPIDRIKVENGITLCVECHAKEHEDIKNLILSRSRRM
jgi:5-methylcytosine-specific restriction endonuclease McrA